MDTARKQSGFTLVELLIVIVIIGILAAVTIISYNGITTKARVAAIQSTLSQNVNLLAQSVAVNGVYPSDRASAGLKAGSGITLTYVPGAGDATYCLQASGWSTDYKVTDDNTIPATGTCTVAPPAFPTPLVAYNFNEGSGLTSADKSGHGHALTIANSSTDWSAAGHTGAGYLMNQSNNHHSTFTLGSGSSPETTVSFWVYRTGLTSGYGGIWDDGTSHLDLEFDTAGHIDLDGYAPSAVIPVNTWTYITYTVSTANAQMILYVNGVQTNTAAVYATMTLGNTYTFGSTPDDAPANAIIDDFRVFNQVLTPMQINATMTTPVS